MSKKIIRRKPKSMPSKSELEHLYVKERKTLQEIGKIYHVNLQKIRKLLVGYGIKIVPRGAQKGHITTPKTRRRIGASNKISAKRFWKALTENEKAERITRPGFFKKGQTSSMKGKKASITTRKKQSRSATIRFQTQKHPHQGTHRSEKTKRLLREARLRQKPTKDETWPEKFAAKMLKKEKITFEKQKSFRNPPCIVDLYIEPKICIFLDGDYWHCNLNDYVYKKKLNPGFKPNDQISGKKYAKDVWAKDKKITRELRKKGYSVLRFWQSELETEPEKCLQKIIKTMKESKQ